MLSGVWGLYRERWAVGRVFAVKRHCIGIVLPRVREPLIDDCELYIIWLYHSACTLHTHFDTIDWTHSHARLRVQKTISHDNTIIIIIWSPHNEGVHQANWHTTYLYTRQYVILYDGNSIMRRSMIKHSVVARAYLQRQFITSQDKNHTHLFYGIDSIDNMIVSIWCRWLHVFLYRSTQ